MRSSACEVDFTKLVVRPRDTKELFSVGLAGRPVCGAASDEWSMADEVGISRRYRS